MSNTILEVQTRFNDWITFRINEYNFVENQDFIIISQNRETIDKNGYNKVSVAIEYSITFDMAKELSMVENNEQGRLFIYELLKTKGIIPIVERDDYVPHLS